METTQAYSESPNFQTVWATLQEIAESHKEFERQMKENDARFEKKLGKLGSHLGDMVEHLVAPNLVEKFHKLGFIFEKIYRDTEIKDTKNNIHTEVDITLENGEKVMIIEVKNKLTTENITEHIERMGKVRAHADLHGDKRKFIGAVAGIVMTDNERAFAFKSGFFIIEPSGETFTINEPQGLYSIREW